MKEKEARAKPQGEAGVENGRNILFACIKESAENGFDQYSSHKDYVPEFAQKKLEELGYEIKKSGPKIIISW